jgi:hypothetical protein
MQRVLAIGGTIAPVLFAGLVIALGLPEPGYDHRTEMMSMWRLDAVCRLDEKHQSVVSENSAQ